jgi:hypothetical protein
VERSKRPQDNSKIAVVAALQAAIQVAIDLCHSDKRNSP